MNFQPQIRITPDLPPLPEPRRQVRWHMQALSMLVDGPVDLQPQLTDSRLANSMLMSQASLLILGTACRRPLLLREAEELTNASDLDVIVVRFDDRDQELSFDIRLQHIEPLLCCYRLWMERTGGPAWLVPTAGEDLFLKITPLGLMMDPRAPFEDDDRRRFGLKRGSDFLSIATRGWF